MAKRKTEQHEPTLDGDIDEELHTISAVRVSRSLKFAFRRKAFDDELLEGEAHVKAIEQYAHS
jgi:hypothetical protein